jgi:hypothetical protein
MSNPTLDAETVLRRVTPVTLQQAHKIQPFGYRIDLISPAPSVRGIFDPGSSSAWQDNFTTYSCHATLPFSIQREGR